MHQSRLIIQLSQLSRADFRKFLDFVGSSYFNQQQRLLRLAGYLFELYPGFSSKAMEKEVLHSFLFGKEETFRAQAVHDQFSQLMKLLRRFLAQQQYEQDSWQQEYYLLQAYAERNELDDFSKAFRKMKARLEDRAEQHPHQYLKGYLLGFLADNQLRSRRRSSGEDTLAGLVEQLDLFYLNSKLKYASEMRNRQAILNTQYDFRLAEELVDFVEKEKESLEAAPAIFIYTRIYKLLTQPQAEEIYQQLKGQLEQDAPRFEKAEAYFMYAFLQNFCIKQINQGNSHYLQELFSLYQTLLSQELLLNEAGYLPHSQVKNIVTVALRLKQFPWVEAFLENYRSRFEPDYRENAYLYNLASYHYEQQNHRQALRLLQQISFTDVFYQLDARALQMKIYYEMEEDDSLMYLVKAFKTFLKRNQELSRRQYGPYENLLMLARRAYRLKIRKGSIPKEKFAQKLDKLSQQVQRAQGVANLNWLKARLAELED